MKKPDWPEITPELLEAISNKVSAKDEKQGDKQQGFYCPSMAAEAATHVRPLSNKPQPSYLAKRGNPTILIPPLYYNPQEQTGWVYIVANKPNGIIYVGQTTNLPRRITEHKEGKIAGFSQQHKCNILVYFEGFSLVTESIEKETKMKDWPRKWKLRRILQTNPEWRDLHTEICQTS